MRNSVVIIATLMWKILIANIAHGAESPPDETANYAFAAYIGSGLYGATDASLFILNVPTTFEWPDRPDIRIRLHTSAGFFDYGRDNIKDLEVPNSIGTLTLIPGVEKTYPMGERWELIPHIDYGFAKNFSTSEEAQVYSIGVHSRFYPNTDIHDHVWVNKLLLAGSRTLSGDRQDNFFKLLTGFDYKTNQYITLKNGQAFATFYGSISWSYNGIDYWDQLEGKRPKDLNYELGISLYAPKPVDLWVTEVERIGIGYQRNPFGTVIRLFAGTPF